MPKLAGGADEIEPVSTSFRLHNSSSRSNSFSSSSNDEEFIRQWAEIQRLPTYQRSRACLLFNDENADGKGKRVIDVKKLGSLDRHRFVERLIKQIEVDNLQLLQKIKKRMDRVDLNSPTVVVKYKNLCVEAKYKLVDGKPLPNLWKSLKSLLSVITKLVGCQSQSQEAKISIVQDVSGIIEPGRLTLLLGPPGCGKTSLLMALSGSLNNSLKVSGDVTYNGYKLNKFVPRKTCAYVSQYDLHIPQITVRESLDFATRCQGVGRRSEIMIELCRKEKQAGIVPDPDIDAYMKAIAAQGSESTLLTDYILKILGLDVCADTVIGDAMRRGISGGQKKRLTTGEMMVGPTKVLFMDEITNGLDSSTAFQLVSCIQHLAHVTDATALIALLQPAPEIFELFDDIILMAEGKVVYHGPISCVLGFFEECGFRCPQRKGVADFLQEAISRKDQWQYWFLDDQPYNHFSVDMFCERFKASSVGRKLYEQVSQPHVKSENDETALSFSVYSLSMWELFNACMSREFLLVKRNSFIYVLRMTQIVILAFITMTVFIRTELAVDVVHANFYLGALFYGLTVFLADGLAEAGLMMLRLPVLFKQRDLCLYPAWAHAIPATLLMIPFSLVTSLVWTSLTYYVTGYSPEIGRFLGQFLLLSLVHFTSVSFYRFLIALFQTRVAALTACSTFLSSSFIFAGFVIPQSSMPAWLKWAFWADPLSYGEIGLSGNEFLAPRWQKMMLLPNTSVGNWVLESRGLDFAGYYYWISVGALIGFAILANVGFTLALTFLKAPATSDYMISREKPSHLQGVQGHLKDAQTSEKSKTLTISTPAKGRMSLPFLPLTITFRNLNYYVDTSVEMRKHGGFNEKKLQLLSGITGAFRPGVLTALMGASGAGKTTLLDVLSGRKTSGYIEGDIRISGFPKIQETFTQVCGYSEQTDLHSPQITVQESLLYSAWLRLPDSIDSHTKMEFVNQVLESIELDEIKDLLVGTPGVSGLSTEQRKRLTIAVELVSNPSIIFLDEPTTGLDARAASIVMRAVKKVASAGRTVVCTIHQPSIHIFEAFDELVLLKVGGQIIYSGPLGQHSQKVIDYFEGISGVPKIRDNYNPATWMLDVTSASIEAQLGLDFTQVYHNSISHKNTEELVKQLSTPHSGSEDLHFPSRFSQNGWEQFKSCLWKLHLSYWRTPSYSLMRLIRNLVSSVILGLLFWQRGTDIKDQQALLTVTGAMMASVLFLGANNCSNLLPFVATERTIVYRERFAGMYSSWAYSLAQVVVELPYLLVEAIMFTAITYPMIGYYSSLQSAYKVFWYCFAMFCNLLSYNLLGMLLVSVTPNYQVAAVVSPALYALFNLFNGFFIPPPRIPKWWIWLHYVCPPAWALRAMLTSQYGDVQRSMTVFGQTNTVAGFLKDYFDFEANQLGLVAAVMIFFPLFFASMFAIFMDKLNFQRR